MLVRFEMVKVPGASLWMGKTEVTWDLYDAFALSRPDSTERHAIFDGVARPTRPYGAPDYGWGHAGFPVISVAHTAAQAFCEWLSAKTGKKYRLPTDSEWEHVAIGRGRKDSRRTRLHAANAGGTTHAVGGKPADALGLHDLFGNAAEWVTVTSGRSVVRGGSFRDRPQDLGRQRARYKTIHGMNAIRRSPEPVVDVGRSFVGFRIVRSHDQQAQRGIR
jgi:formylglycine-generating enzyme required for sulfatase activity